MEMEGQVVEVGSGELGAERGFRMETSRLDQMVNNGMNVQCINSSEFVIGKRTNFNGPVIIVNQTPEVGEPQAAAQERISRPANASTNPPEESYTEKAIRTLKYEEPSAKEKWWTEMCYSPFIRAPKLVWFILFFIMGGSIYAVLTLLKTDTSDLASDAEVISSDKGNFTLFMRKHWGAIEELSSVPQRLPVTYVIVGTTGGDHCTGLGDCRGIIQSMQEKDKKETLADIYFSFLISGDGNIFEGRGWSKRSEFSGFANNRNIGVAFFGEFNLGEEPSTEQMEALQALISYGVHTGRVRPDYMLIPANATGLYFRFGNPIIGSNVYKVIKTWPQFVPDPYAVLAGLTPLPPARPGIQ